MDLTVEGKLFVNGSFENACIGVKDGKIESVKKILKSSDHINFKNKLILPAGIDMHVHFRDPGFTYKEDFSSGSKAALFGGVSCVFDMPNTSPQSVNVPTLIDKIKSFKNKSFVDFGIYAGLTDNNIDDVERLSDYSNGFKIYLGSSTNSLLLSKKNIRSALKKASESDKIVLFHAEDEECLRKHKSVENGLVDHIKNRPSVCEEEAIKNILNASKDLKIQLHICHVSSIEGFEILKNRAANVSFGITPHHSLLDVDNIRGASGFFKVNPPIRSSFDREALFNSLKNGFCDVIESDHAPHTMDEKNNSFNDIPSGVPGVETLYPLFLYLAKKNYISFQRVVSLICKRPSELLGIRKGCLKEGFDADFIVVDLKDEKRVKSSDLHSKCGWSPFEDFNALFPSDVFVRGTHMVEESSLIGSKRQGRFVSDLYE